MSVKLFGSVLSDNGIMTDVALETWEAFEGEFHHFLIINYYQAQNMNVVTTVKINNVKRENIETLSKILRKMADSMEG